MTKSLLAALLFSGAISFPFWQKTNEIPEIPERTHTIQQDEVKIQVALLLDTSNSMDGLIDQAKSQLWKMVNRLADASRQEKNVILEIALFEYGNDGLSSDKGHIRQVQPMKSDLDGLSEKLFSLRTNGGQEYCGWVIQTSLDSLGWTDSKDDLHLIIIAGNEPFDQGKVDFRVSCDNAAKKDIIVNTIFCGDQAEGRKTHWFDCANITKGKFMNIDTDQKVAHIPTPYDTTLMRLNDELNKTYLGFGSRGMEMKERQMMQDKNASEYGAANVAQRALSKSKKSYSNADWDVVDAWTSDSTAVEKLKDEELPAQLKGKSKKELHATIAKLKSDRAKIQRQMADLQIKIDAYTTEERKKISGAQTLDNVLIDALVEQATAKGFKI